MQVLFPAPVTDVLLVEGRTGSELVAPSRRQQARPCSCSGLAPKPPWLPLTKGVFLLTQPHHSISHRGPHNLRMGLSPSPGEGHYPIRLCASIQ